MAHQSTNSFQLYFEINVCFTAVRADPKVRQAVAGAIIKALTAPDIAAKADIPTDKLVVRFSEA